MKAEASKSRTLVGSFLILAACLIVSVAWGGAPQAWDVNDQYGVEVNAFFADYVVRGHVLSNNLFKVEKQYKGAGELGIVDIPDVRELSVELASKPVEELADMPEAKPGSGAELMLQRRKKLRTVGLVGEELILFLGKNEDSLYLKPPAQSKDKRLAIRNILAGSIYRMGGGFAMPMKVKEFEERIAYDKPVLLKCQSPSKGPGMSVGIAIVNLSEDIIEVDLTKQLRVQLAENGNNNATDLPLEKRLFVAKPTISLKPGEAVNTSYLLNKLSLIEKDKKYHLTVRLDLGEKGSYVDSVDLDSE